MARYGDSLGLSFDQLLPLRNWLACYQSYDVVANLFSVHRETATETVALGVGALSSTLDEIHFDTVFLGAVADDSSSPIDRVCCLVDSTPLRTHRFAAQSNNWTTMWSAKHGYPAYKFTSAIGLLRDRAPCHQGFVYWDRYGYPGTTSDSTMYDLSLLPGLLGRQYVWHTSGRTAPALAFGDKGSAHVSSP